MNRQTLNPSSRTRLTVLSLAMLGFVFIGGVMAEVTVVEKKCGRCQVVQPASEFGKSKITKTGLRNTCRDCRRQYLKDNVDALRMKAAANYQKIKHRDKPRRKAYYLAHRDEIMEYYRRWHKANPERAQKHNRAWRAKNKDKDRMCTAKARRQRRAVKVGLDEHFTLAMDVFVKAFWGDRCAICGKTSAEEGQALSIDHWLPLILPSGEPGFPLDCFNAVLLCNSHNCRKSNKMPWDVFDEETVYRIDCMLSEQEGLWNDLMTVG